MQEDYQNRMAEPASKRGRKRGRPRADEQPEEQVAKLAQPLQPLSCPGCGRMIIPVASAGDRKVDGREAKPVRCPQCGHSFCYILPRTRS